jgi:hypothetical protein
VSFYIFIYSDGVLNRISRATTNEPNEPSRAREICSSLAELSKNYLARSLAERRFCSLVCSARLACSPSLLRSLPTLILSRVISSFPSSIPSIIFPRLHSIQNSPILPRRWDVMGLERIGRNGNQGLGNAGWMAGSARATMNLQRS